MEEKEREREGEREREERTERRECNQNHMALLKEAYSLGLKAKECKARSAYAQ